MLCTGSWDLSPPPPHTHTELSEWKVKAVRRLPGSSCHVGYAPGVEDSGVLLSILLSGIRRGLAMQTAHKQSSVVIWMAARDVVCSCFKFQMFTFFSLLCLNVFIINSALFSGWNQSDHGDKSVAETCKFMVHDCANGILSKGMRYGSRRLSYMILQGWTDKLNYSWRGAF